jgi:TPR repeat protein
LNKLLAALLLAATLSSGPALAALSADELAEITSNPSIGLYKGYAEFKMAHYPEARQIWQALAEKGAAEAYFNLGILAEDGLGEPRDPVRAVVLYEQGARGGSVKAQYRLGQIYREGKLVPADGAKAEMWLGKAAESGDQEAASQLAALRGGATAADPYLAARRLESEGRPAEAAAAYQRLSEAGDLRARTRLAWLYEAGRGVGRDLSRAAQLFRSAAEGGEAQAQYALAVMLETGAGQGRDSEESLRWLRRAAASGYPEAIQALRARGQ